ncbi:uncharacterized protein [Clytia hemisphaerica]|uniref:Ig-like domain-containing protein n=1 Tax=Clytia hemisphaerica TaxID=252671 RepID=A0A7M5X297_9CNID
MRCINLVLLGVFLLVRIKGEELTVTLETLSQGTNGIVRVRFTGTFGKSDFISLGGKNFFSQSDSRKTTKVDTGKQIGSILEIELTIIEADRSIEISRVTVTEPDTRLINFNFNSFISDAVSKTVAAPTTDLNSAPTILYQNGNNNLTAVPQYTETEGLDFRLHAQITRTPGVDGTITYQWYRFNSARSNLPVAVTNGNSPSLHVKEVDSADTGAYFCVIKLKESVRKSDSITLIVNYLTLEPVSVSISGSSFVAEGLPASFSCSASSNLPDITVGWFNGTTLLKEGTSRVDLIFDPIQRGQSGHYTCKASVTGLNQEKVSVNRVKVLYLDDPKIRGHTVINNTLTLFPNDSSVLHCDSASNPSGITYTFLEDGNVQERSDNSFIVKTGGGNYSCVVQNDFMMKRLDFQVIAGSLQGPNGEGGNGGNAGTTGASTGDGDDFWTTEMIIIVVMAICFLIIFIILIIFICCLMKRLDFQEKEVKPRQPKDEVQLTENFYKPQPDFQNNYINDTFTSQRGPTLGDIHITVEEPKENKTTSHLSLSSEEYRSSNNDLRQPNGLSNGHANSKENLSTAPPPHVVTDEYATVNKQRKEKAPREHNTKERKDRKNRRDKKDGEQKKSRSKNRAYEEVGENSKGAWDQANDSRASATNRNYDNEEYC